uniref:Uncharacterized protein AlNc14C355G10945 n=1 Tax=Albugo laibachii Nc14 TaxID=890382 RepID=F0WXJ4_9STRA|nr:conserved hypothetical protein [Albugo laibachii Nc14]|eukprot:CCA26188.1 conserved hypothetical protein [Albugo laibachii Nc14]
MSWSSNLDAQQATSEYGQTSSMFDALHEQKAHGSPDSLNDITQVPRDMAEGFCNLGQRPSSTFVLRTQNRLEPSIPIQFRPSPNLIQSSHSTISTTAYTSIPASYNSQVLLDDSTHAELHQLFSNDQARIVPIAFPNEPCSTSINTPMMPMPLSSQLHYQLRNENEGYPIVESISGYSYNAQERANTYCPSNNTSQQFAYDMHALSAFNPNYVSNSNSHHGFENVPSLFDPNFSTTSPNTLPSRSVINSIMQLPTFPRQTTEREYDISCTTKSEYCSNDFKVLAPRSPKLSPDRRKLCCVEGCKSQARAFHRCKRHGGSKRCSFPGCTKSVQSRGLCIRHGGGSRCQESNCTRAAQSHGRCKMHGGGRPCIVPGCEKKAHLKRLCRKHGGGAKCTLLGCDKWAQRQGMCMTHSKHAHGSVTATPIISEYADKAFKDQQEND